MFKERPMKVRVMQDLEDWAELYLGSFVCALLFTFPSMLFSHSSFYIFLGMTLIGTFIFTHCFYSIFEFHMLKKESMGDLSYFSFRLITNIIFCVLFCFLTIHRFSSHDGSEFSLDVFVMAFWMVTVKTVSEYLFVDTPSEIEESCKYVFPLIHESTYDNFQEHIRRFNKQILYLNSHKEEIGAESSDRLLTAISYLNESLHSFEQLYVEDQKEMEEYIQISLLETEERVKTAREEAQKQHKKNIVVISSLLSLGD